MTFKLFFGSVLAFLYNAIWTYIPSCTVRQVFLKLWLKRIGPGTGIQRGCKFLNGRKIEIGDRNVINFGCLFDGRTYRIVTGSDVSIGPEATILTLGHDPRSSAFADRGGDVIIGNYVWIGYRAIILPDINIGEGAVVAAGTVVTKNIAPYTIVAGNPAREIGKRAAPLGYRLSFQPWLL